MGFAGAAGSATALEGGLTYQAILDECARLPQGALWEDRRFPAGDPRTLYVLGRPAGKPYANGDVRWLRPAECKGADASALALIKDGADAGDVIQGELGDCYLLGAMSSIAAKGLLPKLFKAGVDPMECIARGFCTFTLYKFGEWVEVSVDTLVPCNADSEPIFAHAKDPSELWVCLLEKAYAKLHGSFEALDGGSVTAALVDLTGGVGESIDMTDEDVVYEIADGSMWKRLRRYGAKPGYLLGAALSQSAVADSGGHEAMQVTDLGILVNHAYSLIGVAEVGEPHQEKLRLLQLRNPWGMKEWEGPWGDNAQEWETAAGKKAKEKLGVEFKDDGTFWIAWEDFQAHFNKVYVCRIFETATHGVELHRGQAPPANTWCRYEVEGEWTAATAGGCFNFPEWRRNPQFELRTADSTDAVFILMQPDPRLDPSRGARPNGAAAKSGGDEGGPKYDNKIGMYVMKGHDVYRRKVLFDSEEVEGDEVSDSTPFMAYREVVCNTMDEEEDLPLAPYQRYVLCPSTFAPGLAGKFRIIVLTDKPLDHAPELLPALNEVKVTGSWAENNAGGCRNFVTWRRNEQYALQLSRAARVSCVLLRHSAEPPSDVALHSKKSKAKPRRKKKDEAAPLIGFVVAAAEHGSAERKRLAIGNDDVVDKTKFVPSVEVAAEFYHDEPGGGLFVVVPSTFEPGELGDYELIVYTDDEAASLRRIEPSTWHLQEAKGEWTRTTAGGCRNNPTWVRNPLYSVRATRASHCQLFLRQAERPAGGADAPEYDGIGFYLTADDGQLSLEDLCCESGFRQQQESSATFELQADVDYLLIPMTYKRGIEMSFEMELYCDTPTLRLHQLGEPEAHGRRLETLENEAALTIQRAMARKQIYRELRAYPPNRERARQMMKEWFGKPTRDNDEGYLDINLALNALESAFIQLTGKAGAKGQFFPEMRDRLKQRGHKVADYDVCL